MTNMPTTPRYQAIMAAAEVIAAQFGSATVGVEHLQLAIVRDPHAVPTQVLHHKVGIDTARFDKELTTLMHSDGYNRR